MTTDVCRKKRKIYAVRRHDRSLCTQKQPEAAALKAAMKKSDPVGGQSVNDYRCMYVY